MEILIGREVSGGLNIRVNQKYNRVSREHAKVFFEKGGLYIQDLNSANGTFVNGNQISKIKLKTSDKVLLGSNNIDNGYILNINKLIKEIEEAERYKKEDYSQEFLKIGRIYDSYKKEIKNKKKQVQKQKELPILRVSFLMTLLTIIVFAYDFFGTYEKFVEPVITLVTCALVLFYFHLRINIDMEEIIDSIHEKYEDQYICPRCMKRLDLEDPWRKYKKDGKCPHNCGAKY